MTCGWNAKYQTYDAVPFPSDDPKTLQYAHRACVERIEVARS